MEQPGIAADVDLSPDCCAGIPGSSLLGQSPPLAEDQPTFAISTTQQQLVPLLINARNEVEAYRKQHGVLPDQIDLNIAGVDFFLSPESKSYVIMAVTEGQNLAITQEGHWFWAQ